jgi:hypothetical protein
MRDVVIVVMLVLVSELRLWLSKKLISLNREGRSFVRGIAVFFCFFRFRWLFFGFSGFVNIESSSLSNSDNREFSSDFFGRECLLLLFLRLAGSLRDTDSEEISEIENDDLEFFFFLPDS